MKYTTIALMAAALALAACNNNSTGTDGGTNTDGGTKTPAAPTLGAQIDRMGRAGVNTALTDPFDLSTSVAGSTEDQVKDAYNADSDVGQWSTNHKAKIAFNLAVLDSLDGTCGNQFAAGASVAAGQYDALAGVLADDQLYVNTASGSCTTYLGVEANATTIIPNSDCGGRTPTEDVIDETYSLLAAGAVMGVSDNVANDSTLDNNTFPFLAAPN